MKKIGHTFRKIFNSNNNENGNGNNVNNNDGPEEIPLNNIFIPSGISGIRNGNFDSYEKQFSPLSIQGQRPSTELRYKKTRNKLGGNERDHWKEENLIHMKAFENDLEKVKELIEKHGNDLFQPIQRHTYFSENETEKYRQPPIFFAALGSSLDTSKYFVENGFYEDSKKVSIHLDKKLGSSAPSFNNLKPLHLIALYGGQPSHLRASNNIDELTEIFLNATESNQIPDVFDSFRTTPLHYACMSGNLKLVKKLISIGANINSRQDITKMTPLHFACQYEEEEIIKYLISKNANLYLIDENGNTPLHFVVRCSDNVKIVKEIINSVSIEKHETFICVKNHGGIAALRIAVEHNRLKIAEYLLKFHVSTHHHPHETLLLHLAAQKKNVDMALLLIECGWSIEERDNRGQTPLHFAAEEDNMEFVKGLLFKYANLEARDEKGYTPLLAAASKDSLNVVKLLLQENALITALSFYGETILGIATKHNSTKVVKFLMSSSHDENFRKTMSSLLREPDIELDTPLHNVARTGNIEIFKTIINFYAETNLRNSDLQTSLHIAVSNGQDEIARMLLKISFDSINLVDKYQATPLFLAVKNESISMIKLLINNGANTLAQIDDKKIPLDIAIKSGNLNIVKILLEELRDDEDESRKVFPLHDAIEKRQLKVLKLIIEKKYARIDQVNDKNQTCLELAIETNFIEGVNYLLNYRLWKRLLRRRYKLPTNSDPHPKSAMQLLIINMPEMAKMVFDKCIKKSTENGGGETIYHFYEFLDDIYFIPNPIGENNKNKFDIYKHESAHELIPYYPLNNENGNEGRLKKEVKSREHRYENIIADHPLTLMLKHHHYDLISHELVESYITSKWNNFAKWGYYPQCYFHLIFAIFLTFITVNIKPERVMSEEEKQRINYKNECLMNSWQVSIVTFFGVFHLLLGLFKLNRQSKSRSSYLLSLVVALLTFIVGFPLCQQFGVSTQWKTLVILNFCTWFNLLNVIKKSPRFGVYILMVIHTVMSFLRFAPVFIMFLLPFVVSFHVLLGEERGINSFFATIIRTLVMMTGEFNYEDSVSPKATLLTYVIFFLFLFMVSVFLMNLLIGLAVSDTTKTLEKAWRTRMRLQIETIQHVEIMMPEFSRQLHWRGFQKLKDPKSKKHWFSFDAFCNWFRWLGVSKNAMRQEMSIYGPSKLIIPSSDKSKSHPYKLTQSEDLAVIRQSISSVQNNIFEMKQGIRELTQLLNQQQKLDRVPFKFIDD